MLIVAWAGVWGAAYGTYLTGALLLGTDWGAHVWLGQSLLLVVLAFYTMAGVGSILLLRHRPLGRHLLILAQFPQLMFLQTQDITYSLASGVYGLVGVQDSSLHLGAGITSTFTINWGQQDQVVGFGVNVVAFAVLVYLLNHPIVVLPDRGTLWGIQTAESRSIPETPSGAA